LHQRRPFLSRALIAWEKGTNRFDFLQGKVDKYYWIDLGSSFVPNELMSTFLLAQLFDAETICRKRAKICSIYHDLLLHLCDGQLLQRIGYGSNGHIFWILFSDRQARERAERWLKELGVQCFTHYIPLHCSEGGEKFGRVSGLSITQMLQGLVFCDFRCGMQCHGSMSLKWWPVFTPCWERSLHCSRRFVKVFCESDEPFLDQLLCTCCSKRHLLLFAPLDAADDRLGITGPT
jgi:hypothetical protein